MKKSASSNSYSVEILYKDGFILEIPASSKKEANQTILDLQDNIKKEESTCIVKLKGMTNLIYIDDIRAVHVIKHDINKEYRRRFYKGLALVEDNDVIDEEDLELLESGYLDEEDY